MRSTLALCFVAISLFAGNAQAQLSNLAAAQSSRYSHQVLNTTSGLPQDTVRQFLQTHDGYIWMATDGGLVRFDGIDFSSYTRRNTPQMQSDLVNALDEDDHGSLWIATSNGLLKRRDGRFTLYRAQQGLGSDIVLAVHHDHAGRLCATTTAGVDCLTGDRFVVSAEQPSQAIASPHATTPDGSQWTVTETGLARLHHGQSTAVSMPEGFTGPDILTLYSDREGNLWAGSENAGAAILRQPAFTTLGKKDGLASDQVRSLTQSSNGDIWFGTAAGLTHLHQGVFSTLTVAQGLPSNEIIALASAADGSLWVGTPDGLAHLASGRTTTLTADDGLPDNDIRSLLEARDHSLWIGTTHGLAHLQPGPNASAIHTWTTADRLPSNVIGSLLEEPDGSLSVGTRGGLAHLHNGQVEMYADAFGPRSPIVTALGNGPGGTLWVGTAGLGFMQNLGGRDLFGIRVTSALPRTIYSILPDTGGGIWMSSTDGIYRLTRSQLSSSPGSTLDATRFDVADGLRINDCSSGGHPEAMRTADGRLFFATAKGVSIVNPAELTLHPTPPPVVLESILIDDATASPTASPGKDLHVPAGHERIAFHYAGLSFAAPSKVVYRYQLAPFDRKWIDAGPRRTAYYTNIAPGRYQFRVQASTDGSTWSTAAAITSLTIAPHYYQTWWFYSAVAILLLLIAWQLYLYRLRQVELRFNAVLAERGRIAREIHDTLAQDIVAISVQLDLVARLMTLSVDKAMAQLVTTRELVRKGLAEARSSIWDLRASTSASSDLPTRLRETVRKAIGDAALELNLVVTGTYRSATRALEDELLRIAQEAITNTIRHAQAKTVHVTLTYNATTVELRIHDDGRGFTPVSPNSGPPGHYGIRGMHERAERANARLTIDSSPGNGTTVIAKARL